MAIDDRDDFRSVDDMFPKSGGRPFAGGFRSVDDLFTDPPPAEPLGNPIQQEEPPPVVDQAAVRAVVEGVLEEHHMPEDSAISHGGMDGPPIPYSQQMESGGSAGDVQLDHAFLPTRTGADTATVTAGFATDRRGNRYAMTDAKVAGWEAGAIHFAPFFGNPLLVWLSFKYLSSGANQGDLDEIQWVKEYTANFPAHRPDAYTTNIPILRFPVDADMDVVWSGMTRRKMDVVDCPHAYEDLLDAPPKTTRWPTTPRWDEIADAEHDTSIEPDVNGNVWDDAAEGYEGLDLQIGVLAWRSIVARAGNLIHLIQSWGSRYGNNPEENQSEIVMDEHIEIKTNVDREIRIKSATAISGGTVVVRKALSGGAGSIEIRQGVGTEVVPGRIIIGDQTQHGDIVLETGITYGGNLIVKNLPITDPAVVGALWRSENDLKISTGA